MTTRATIHESPALIVVERWARAARILYEPLVARPRRLGWYLSLTAPGFVHVWYRYGMADDACVSWGYTVTIPTIVLWALAVESGLTVDVGRCQACVARGGSIEWTHLYNAAMRDAWVANGWTLGTRHWVIGVWLWPGTRPCRACNGTGRHMVEAARLVLDAARQWGTVADDPQGLMVVDSDRKPRPAVAGEPVIVQPGNSQARANLTVLADRLQAEGDPLGTWLALWLAGADETEWLPAAAARLDGACT